MTRFTKIEIIFDRDHGTHNQGWYARTTDEDGQQEDQPINEDWWEDALVPKATILDWAMLYYADLDGMTADELDELRDRIEVKRS